MIAIYEARFTGTGKYVPKKILNNYDLEKMLDTSDEWIKTRTGMFERRIADPSEASSDLAYEASKIAIQAAGLKPKDIDMIIVGTISPDHLFPSTACILQKKLGTKNCPAFDISAGCTGFVYAASIGHQFVVTGKAKNVLVVGVEILSRITNWDDRGTAVLFGDGSGAAVISRTEPTSISKIIDFDMSADGTFGDLLIIQAGGSRMPPTMETVRDNKHTLYMEGNKIFKLAVRSMQESAETLLHRNRLDIRSIDWLIPHQANLRIIESLGKKLNIDLEKVIVTIDKYANTSSSTIPIALDDAIRSNKIRHGDLVLLVAFGAGLTWGGILFRY
ncbi:MAG: ketoacyl-ACP synthase III [Candidatus Cloacimonetes bacterium]|nr:ketoacyl-ACP synthase III [Candidatus Cloacimonadota bacterium]